MNNRMKNEMFFVACDYLFREKLVTSQKDLAKKIGISESAYSRLKNGTKGISDETLRKMNEAFGHIFNMAYFRGQSTKLLMSDVNYPEDHHPNLSYNMEAAIPPHAAESDNIPYSTTPHWAQQMAQKNEVLTQELRSLHLEIAALRITIDSLIKTLKS